VLFQGLNDQQVGEVHCKTVCLLNYKPNSVPNNSIQHCRMTPAPKEITAVKETHLRKFSQLSEVRAAKRLPITPCVPNEKLPDLTKRA